ncbi:MAG: hypothetical protein AB7O98_05475 [Hyphomonadaceae bacterium]
MLSQCLAPPSEWSVYVQDAAWLPHVYDVRRDTLTFAHMPREAQQRAVFLDPRFVTRGQLSPAAPVLDLPACEIEEAKGPIHFIFHTAFCCSTLLTRALDQPGLSMGLKEPAVLVSFAEYWSRSRRTPGAFAGLETTLNLLSRPLTQGETQIVKPSNVANHIIPQFLHARPDAKALVLYSGLDAFLRAIARRGIDGRLFARQVFQQFEPVIPLDSGFAREDVLLHTDLQIAAEAWLMQATFLDKLAQRFPQRVRTLSSDSFLADTAGAMTKLGAFFGLQGDAARWQATATSPIFSEHAKEYGRAFDAGAYRAQHDQAAATYGAELRATRDWAHALAEQCNAPLTLGETLLA